MQLPTVITIFFSFNLTPKVIATAIAAHANHPAHLAMHEWRAITNEEQSVLCTETLITTEFDWVTTTVYVPVGQVIPSNGNASSNFAPTVQTVQGTCAVVYPSSSPSTTPFSPSSTSYVGSPGNFYESTHQNSPTSLSGGSWSPSASQSGASWSSSTAISSAYTSPATSYTAPSNSVAPTSQTPSTSYGSVSSPSTSYGGAPSTTSSPSAVSTASGGTVNKWCTDGWGATSGEYNFKDTPAACGTCSTQCTSGKQCNGPFSYFTFTESGMFCGYTGMKKDMLVVAVPMGYMGWNPSYGDNQPRDPNCNRKINLEIFGKSATAYVVDRCGTCGGDGLDLSEGVYSALGLSISYTAAPPMGTWSYAD